MIPKNYQIYLILLKLILPVINLNCSYLYHNCLRCNEFQCTYCVRGYKMNDYGDCSIRSGSYTILIIVTSVLLGAIFLLACGCVIYRKVFRYKNQNQIPIQVQVPRYRLPEMNHIGINIPSQYQIPPSNRMMLPSAPTLSFLNAETCSICLQSNIEIRSSCQHYFHLRCIIQWTTKSLSCPNCRQQTPLFMILCRKCNSFNEKVKLCGPRCRLQNHQQCFNKINRYFGECRQCGRN